MCKQLNIEKQLKTENSNENSKSIDFYIRN